MTVICYRDGVMAADGSTWQDDILISMSTKKIKRLADGSFYACAGSRSHIASFDQWVLSGRSDERPSVPDDESFAALFVECDGTVLKYRGNEAPYTPAGDWAIEGAHGEFMNGLLCAGLSAEETIRIAIERGCMAAGDIQVERLNQ